MSNAVSRSGFEYTVKGTVTDKANQQGVLNLQVVVYDKDKYGKDDFLGIGVTDAAGAFSVTFNVTRFISLTDWRPDLYFIVEDSGHELLNTKENVIEDADSSTPEINLEVDLSEDKLRQLINKLPAPGWVGGFAQSESAFAYPTPDFSNLTLEENRKNIDKLQRQLKVLWPEFSWESKPGKADPKRCYQMFAPDISRLGYTNEGKVYSIICPQQGAVSPHLGSMNVEITVTGNRGWVDETTKELAADMTVEGRIWFSPSAHDHVLVKELAQQFKKQNFSFPSTKANAIRVRTHQQGNPDQKFFSLSNGPSTNFPIPDFAKHEEISWTMGHLSVEIGSVVETGNDVVDKFNQRIVDIFNTASGNMLEKGNLLTWNVWFTAPELVDQDEWTAHTEKWRESIQADYGAPNGPGTIPRYFDGTPFKPMQELFFEKLPLIIDFLKEKL